MFILGLGGVYVDKFIYTEAVSLASFERYTNTMLCVLSLELIIILILELWERKYNNLVCVMAVLVIVGVLSPVENTGKYLMRVYPEEQHNQRENTDEFSKKLINNCEPGSNVYFLSQSDYGKNYIYVKFMIRPNLSLQSIAGDDYNWCFVNEADSSNIYFKEMHLEEWKEIIFESGKYDYFAMMKCDDYIRNEFESIFAKADEIIDNAIYRVDAKNKKLILVSN